MNEVIPNRIHRSPYEEALITVYDNTNGPIQGKLYQMVNVALVAQKIRSGTLLAGIQPDRIATVIKSLQSLELHAKVFFYSKQSQDRNEPIILVINDKVNENLLYYFNDFPSTPPNRNNRANNQKRNSQDIYIGNMLGYFNPIPILQDSRLPTGNLYISVTVKGLDGTTYNLKIFPQKIRLINEQIRSKLDTMADQIRTLDLPLGYQIENVNPIITPPPEEMRGGTRRRRARKRQTRRRR
jgi:hypothetical protein